MNGATKATTRDGQWLQLVDDGAGQWWWQRERRGVLRAKSCEKTMNSERVSQYENLTGFMVSVQLITEA